MLVQINLERCALKVLKRFVSHTKYIKHKMVDEPLPPHRENPVIKTLNTPEFKSVLTPELDFLSNLFKKYDYELRLAGGPVRDILMGISPKDIDLASTATPQEMKDMFNKEQIRLLNANGEKHGTITSRINDKANFEVTTLRIDVTTNGRHADVMFTKDWLLDASRRDLTINSMFMDLDGNVYDYFYGHDDLLERKVRFVGEPAKRITEDFLRILRYFRFYGRIAKEPDNHDEYTINAIKENIQGLEIISGERIWNEWSKILSGKFHRELTIKMLECGSGKYMGLPEDPNIKKFEEISLRAMNNNIELQPISLVASFLSTSKEVENLENRLKFSKHERQLCFFLVATKDNLLSVKDCQKIILKNNIKAEYVYEKLKYDGQLEQLKELENWKKRFPINGHDVKPFVKNNKLIADVLDNLKDIWVDQDCEMSKRALAELIPDLCNKEMEKYQLQSKSPNKKVKVKH